jgi:hypothetical protein
VSGDGSEVLDLDLGGLDPVALGLGAALIVVVLILSRLVVRLAGSGLTWPGHGRPDDEEIEF